ncbi:hypothetical protein JCM9534A_62440 [Catenuloplanes indicus JCM 9534]
MDELRRALTLRSMFNGDTLVSWRRRATAGALSFAAAGLLAAGCTPVGEPATAASGASGAPVAAPVFDGDPLPFGPDGFGRITVGMKEEEALLTGDLQATPISTVLGRNVYSFVGGPEPDPSRMAADEELEAKVAKADDPAAANSKDNFAQLYADSTKRTLERMHAYLDAGGASFRGGYLDSIAAPKDAVTAEGIKRGSSRADLEAAYENLGLAKGGDGNYKMPAGREWQLIFEMDRDKVKYMSLARRL